MKIRNSIHNMYKDLLVSCGKISTVKQINMNQMFLYNDELYVKVNEDKGLNIVSLSGDYEIISDKILAVI